MFDDLVINDSNNGECEKSCKDVATQGQVPDPNANIVSGKSGTSGGGSPPIKKIRTTQAPPVSVGTGSVPTQVMPSAVVLDFDLAKMFMLDCFLKDSLLEKKYLAKIADMIEFAVNVQGLSVHNDRVKIAEMILAEIFY